MRLQVLFQDIFKMLSLFQIMMTVTYATAATLRDLRVVKIFLNSTLLLVNQGRLFLDVCAFKQLSRQSLLC